MELNKSSGACLGFKVVYENPDDDSIARPPNGAEMYPVPGWLYFRMPLTLE